MNKMTALELGKAIKEKKVSVTDAVSAYLDKIEKTGKQFNAFLAVSKDTVLARAKEVQAQIDSGKLLSPLAGVPVAVKDNINTTELETTCASKMLSGYTPVFNAAVVEKLEQAGMIVIGKTNMDEFAIGGSSETGIAGAVRNPWDVTRVAGGSSGGSAAAIAAGLAPLALATDTGGSIRKPCSFCGVTGIKPTYGAVSRYGAIAFASSMDAIGPIGQDIEDCAAMLSVISGPDSRDSTCVIDKPFDFNGSAASSGSDMKGVKIGLPKNFLQSDIDEEVKTKVFAAADEYKAAGASIEEFEMPLTDYMVQAFYIISSAEASSNLACYDGLKFGYRSEKAKTLSEVYRLSRGEGFGMEVKRRIMFGSLALSSDYYEVLFKKALQARTLIIDAYKDLFKRFDMILSPVASGTAFKLGENIGDLSKKLKGTIFTSSVNLAGLPAASLPCGFDKQGLPVGFQLIGEAFSESKLVAAARVYQSRTDYHTKRPGAVL